MNYRELARAKFLLDRLENINRLLQDIVEYNFVEIRSDHFREYFEDENKKRNNRYFGVFTRQKD